MNNTKSKPRLLNIFRSKPAIVIGLALLGLLLGACSLRGTQASITMIDEAEASWQANPVSSYKIVVDVERPDDRRRNELTVIQGQVTRAVVSYWDQENKRWMEPYALLEEQAFPFTVPGLFDMVRGELRSSGRVDIRVIMKGKPVFPHRITMGPVWVDAQPYSGTEATVIVREFEPLDTND